jgi:hypothetical protein
MTKDAFTNVLLFFCLALYLHGCASTGFLMAKPEVTMFMEAGEPKAATDHIDIYVTKTPEKDYEELAKIEVGDTDDDWSLSQIKIKAREIGADAVIITGRVGSYGYVAGTGTNAGTSTTTTGLGVGEGYGLVGIAIRYK